MKLQNILCTGIGICAASTSIAFASAFTFQSIPRWSRSVGSNGAGNNVNGNGHGGMNPPPRDISAFDDSHDDDEYNYNNMIAASIFGFLNDKDDSQVIHDSNNDLEDDRDAAMVAEVQVRGGNTAKAKSKSSSNNVKAGGKSSLQTAKIGKDDAQVVHDSDNVLEKNQDTAMVTEVQVRGGSTAKAKSKSSANNVIAGGKSSLQTAKVYWSDAFQNLKLKVDSINPLTKQKSSPNEDEIDPTTIKIQAVIAPHSDILPENVVRSAAQRSGLLGSVMRPDKVKECAGQLKKWYVQRGYVLHSVTGATLFSDNATATLKVEEPIMSSMPLDIRFAKEVPIDPESGQTTTRRKYREKLERRRGRPLRQEEWVAIAKQLNSTLIEAEGRTNPHTLSTRMGMEPGGHFRWDGMQWQKIAGSGIFSKIWRTNPVQMGDGTVQMQVLCQESPPRNLEYGISKSLYTGHWEGELDFKHENLLGGGESLGVVVRRGARDPEPSVTLRYTDDKFGLKGGYDAELFRDFLAVDDDDGKKGKEDTNSDGDIDESSPVPTLSIGADDDSLLCRQGVRFSLRGPIPVEVVNQSSASAAFERTSTRKGKHETIGSATVGLGPFIRNLPLGARTSLSTSVTSGARLAEKSALPYSSGSVTSRQMFPLFAERIATTSDQVNLAIQHKVMAATNNIPLHEANAAGFSSTVRGSAGGSEGPIDSSIVGSVEVRVPITIPFQQESVQQDGSLVIFGDWMCAHRYKVEGTGGFEKDNMFGKSSIGIGLRKSFAGIPLKFDAAVSREGKLGTFVSLGRDWAI